MYYVVSRLSQVPDFVEAKVATVGDLDAVLHVAVFPGPEGQLLVVTFTGGKN